jgi:hypothetical protein
MKRKSMMVALAVLLIGGAASAERQCGEDQFLNGGKCYNSLGDIPGRTRGEPTPPDPSDVNVGKPPDISQELFAPVRVFCAKQWGVEYRMRVHCEKAQFDAIRKLRGDNDR